ncbi:secretin receptor-like isoform X2 [Babylonia areolata]
MDEAQQVKHLARARYSCWLQIRHYLNTSQDADPEVAWCPVVWDDVLCWPQAPPGTVQTQPCPDYIHGFDTSMNATRECTDNGTWYYSPVTNRTWTNFSACFDPAVKPTMKDDISAFAPHAAPLKMLYTVGYGVSLASLIVAVIIMCCCSRLKSKSNTLHVNLFMAFILRAVVSFAKELLFVQDLGFHKDVRRMPDGRLEFIQHGTHWECRALMSLFVYAICVSQMWIFVEGLYLHMLIYRTLSTERRGVRNYVLLGWLSPLLFFIPWMIAKVMTDNHYCWTISTKPDLVWILRGPMMATVIVNFVFLLIILRVLVSRVRSADRHTSRQQQYRRLAKFILVLVPLFGVMYIVIYVVFPFSFSRLDITQLYVEMAYNSFQGFILALLFCFLNEEVHAEIRRLWMRKKSMRRDSMALTRSFALSSFRKPSLQAKASLAAPTLTSSSTTTTAAATTSQNNNHPHHQHPGTAPTFHLTRACSDSSGSDGGVGRSTTTTTTNDDWLLRVKERARRVFLRKKSSESREGVVDTRYDCDGVPDIDLDLFVFNRGEGEMEGEEEGGGQANHHHHHHHLHDCCEASDCLTFPKG